MSRPALRTEELGKRYRIGTVREPYGRLTESIVSGARSAVRLRRGRSPKSYVWALRDVSLEVNEGEMVGIIGRNGAGKTTLLRILSGITDPTEGRAGINGSVGSLLEVGTGFHPELTGRENIFLNGAILGMSRREIQRKFSDIVDFSEVGAFLDTPVKRYSSGMYVRLAFSVAAHLESDVLIVDEVLAVGDAAFQKKCLGMMRDVSSLGRTVLFVSHNMAMVQSLCSRGVLLDKGRVVDSGPTATIVERYLATVETEASGPLVERGDRRGSGRLRITELTLRNGDGEPVDFVQTGDSIRLALGYEGEGSGSLPNVVTTVAIDSLHGERITVLQNEFAGEHFAALPSRGIISCEIPRLPLRDGLYTLTVFVTVNGVIADWVIGAGTIRVEPGDFYGSGHYPDAEQGKILVDQVWMFEGA